MRKRVLGFDISSTTIGWCVLDIIDNEIKLVKMDYVKPPKDKSIIDRLFETRSKIQTIINRYKPDYIGIEDIIQFMKGASTAQTIIVLTTFNRMVCLLARDYLNKNPELFSVMTIRHGLKINKDLPKKEDIPALVSQHLGINFPYILSTKGKNKGKIKVESYDMADGVAVALFYAKSLMGQTKRKVKI